jgi:hypothetical protein
MKLVLKVLGIVFLLFVVVSVISMFYLSRGLEEGLNVNIAPVDLSLKEDGVYKGSYDFGRWSNELNVILEKPLDSIIHPYDSKNKEYVSGSTDVGDVTYVVPTLNFHIATACVGNVGHTWQMTAQSLSSVANKGMLTAAKAMALSAVRTMDKPEIIQNAKEFVLKQNNGAYECPLPNSVKPPVGRY